MSNGSRLAAITPPRLSALGNQAHDPIPHHLAAGIHVAVRKLDDVDVNAQFKPANTAREASIMAARMAAASSSMRSIGAQIRKAS